MSLGEAIAGRRTAVLGLTLLLAGAGAWTAASMPVAIFPEVAFHRIALIARAGILPVEQTVTTLTQPLESALASVLGVERVRTTTTRGGVEVDLRFGWEEDMDRALARVNAATEEARAALPPDTEIETRLLDTSAFPIVGIAVTSKTRTPGEVSDYVLYEAAPRLRTVPGVYRVETTGAKVREIALTLDPAAMVTHRLDLAAVEAAIRGSNAVAGVGRVRDEQSLVLNVAHGEGTDLDSLRRAVVKEDAGKPVTLGEVAAIEIVLREDFVRTAAGGETAVLIGVSRQPSGDVTDISRGVAAIVRELSAVRPDLRFTVFYDQADLVHDAIGSVREAIAIGLVLAVATIFFFIGDFRATVVAAAVIPVTMLVTTIAMRALGMTFNLMTLGGIAAGIGLVIDDAIVVVENFHRHRLRGEDALAALTASTAEIAPALVGSTLTPVAVLLPLCFLGEVPGGFFRPLAVTMSIALLVSLAAALTFTPALTAALEPGRRDREVGEGPGDRLSRRLAESYARILGATLRRPWAALVVGVVFVAVAWFSYARLETGFVPEMDEGAFIVDYWAPPGASLEETTRVLGHVDEVLRTTPEVASFSRRTGSELGFFLTETNSGDFAVRLRKKRSRSVEEVISDVRQRSTDAVPTLRTEFIQILQDMIGDLSGNPDPVEVELFGADRVALEATAKRAEALVREVPGIIDSFDGITPLGPSRRLVIDEWRAGLVGLAPAAIEHWLETAVTGEVVGQILQGDRAIPLRLQYPNEFRARPEALDGLVLVGADGRPAPLRSLLRVEPGAMSAKQERENLRSLVRVTARIEERDLGSVMRDVRKVLRDELPLPAGVSLEYGGLDKSQRRAFVELFGAFLASLASVSVLLLIEFGQVAAVVAIVLGSVLALSGSLATLWVTGTALNVSSIVGMIMVLGIVAKNGILLLDFASRRRAAGAELDEALVEAGHIRLRPILMTSLAAVAGLAPLAFGIGAGSEMQQPLAIAILGGVSVSMIFSLLGVPLIYRLLASRSGATGPLSGC